MVSVAIVGGGPAGLMAAEVIAGAGHAVCVYDHKPSPARKLLRAGRGGLNLTHSEALDAFLDRYGAARPRLEPALRAFPPEALRAWSESLGQPTFVGSSGRVFPQSFKASPLVRAWLARLDRLGVRLALRHRWTGWDESGALTFDGPDGQPVRERADALVLALGGASWPRLGSDGGWVPILKARGVAVTPLRPANCGFVVPWSEHFATRFAGTPLKPLALSFGGRIVRGEAVVTACGIEGGAVYALSAALRDAIEAEGSATLSLDLRPGVSGEEVARRLSAPRGSRSVSTWLRSAVGLPPVAVALLRETGHWQETSGQLSRSIKSLQVIVRAPAPLDHAISTAGGVALDAVDECFMLHEIPGVFVAGEMLDWEAPTGGYLLQGCFATAVAAAGGVLRRLSRT